MEKCILRERLGEDICNLLSSRDWENFNETKADMLSEVMIFDVDVLGSRSQLGKAPPRAIFRYIRHAQVNFIRLKTWY